MAPRRGGGGGGGGSVSFYCHPSAYQYDYARITIAFAALFFFAYVALGFVIPSKKKRATLNGGQPPHGTGRWTALGFSISFAILDLVLFVAWYSMQECRNGYIAILAMSSSATWVENISLVTLWGVILNPVCKALHKVRGSTMSKLISVGHSVYIGWLVLLRIIWLSVFTAATHLPSSGGSYNPSLFESLYKASNAMLMTAAVFGLVGMLIAAASMIIALFRSPQLKTGHLKVWIYLLAFSSIAHSVFSVAFTAYFSYGTTPYIIIEETMNRQQQVSLAQQFLYFFFWGLMFLSAAYILKDPSVLSAGAIPAAGPLPTNPHGDSGQAPTGHNPFPYNPNPNYAPNPHVAYNPNPDPNYAPNPHVAYNPNPDPNYAPYKSPPALGHQGVNYTPVQTAQGQTHYQY